MSNLRHKPSDSTDVQVADLKWAAHAIDQAQFVSFNRIAPDRKGEH